MLVYAFVIVQNNLKHQQKNEPVAVVVINLTPSLVVDLFIKKSGVKVLFTG